MQHYQDYYWKEGVPYGIEPVDPSEELSNYKIVIDPYRKRISIEQYRSAQFEKVVYDSALFDFRHLKPIHQVAWQKVPIEVSDNKTAALIRNQDDRVILIEEYQFEEGRCRSCTARSIHGIPISEQKIQYKALGDKEDGVYLFDMNDHLVMYKLYKCDSATGEFTDVIQEEWNMKKVLNYEL